MVTKSPFCDAIFSVFTETLPDPVDISFEYLSLCHQYPGIASLQAVQTHVRHFIEFQWYGWHFDFLANSRFTISSGRETWFNKFRTALSATRSIEDIEHLVYLKLERWRGRKSRYLSDCWENQDKDSTSSSESDHSDLSAGDLDLLTMPWTKRKTSHPTAYGTSKIEFHADASRNVAQLVLLRS